MSNQVDLQRLMASANYAAETARKAYDMAQGDRAQLVELVKNANLLNQTMARLTAQRTGGNPALQYIENVPGRRIAFDYLVAIQVQDGVTSEVQGSITISQDGPFVAVSRQAYFLSQASFQYTTPGTNTSSIFNGRSYGRWRPIHSAWDLNDGIPRSEVVQAVPAPGSGAPHIISPSNASSWRSMQGDFLIKMENAGSSFPRSNIPVPSAAYTKQINSPFNLGALDFFERGETITFKVQPTHPNNPAYGNIQSFTGPGNDWPFLASQFDAVEGINDEIQADDVDGIDPVTRLSNGILYIGMHGYRIIQPAGAGPY